VWHGRGGSARSPDEAVIAAAADNWCANTVRLQVGQANLVSTAGRVHQAFLAAVTTEVRFAEARGLVVALNLQWQLDGASLVESMPTRGRERPARRCARRHPSTHGRRLTAPRRSN
jgi:hypothetical protein